MSNFPNRLWQPRISAEILDGDINPPKLLLKPESSSSRSHNSSLIVKELIKSAASLLTEFYDVNFTTGQAKSSTGGRRWAFWLLKKGVNGVFKEHSARTHRIPTDLPTVPANYHRAEDWQRSTTLLALSWGALPIHWVCEVYTFAVSWCRTGVDHQTRWRERNRSTVWNHAHLSF